MMPRSGRDRRSRDTASVHQTFRIIDPDADLTLLEKKLPPRALRVIALARKQRSARGLVEAQQETEALGSFPHPRYRFSKYEVEVVDPRRRTVDSFDAGALAGIDLAV